MIDTPNTKKVIEKLRKYTDKPVKIKPISELILPDNPNPVDYLGGAEESDDCINIWLSDRCPEETFIHEIIHIILKHEDFPKVLINEDFVRNNSRKKRVAQKSLYRFCF